MASPRDIILAQLDAWVNEGLISAEQYAALRTRAAADSALDTVAPAAQSPPPAAPFGTGARGSEWLQLVGGGLLGAALVALVAFLDFTQSNGAIFLLGTGIAALGAGIVLALRAPIERIGLADAALAAGLVAVTIGAAMGSDTTGAYGLLAAALAVGTILVRRGQGPIVVLASAAWAGGTLIAIQAFREPSSFSSGMPLWLVALAALAGFLILYYARETWSHVSAGLLVAPQALALVVSLDELTIAGSRIIEMLLALFLGAWLAVGIWRSVRAVVAVAAAGLVIDAVVFAFDLGGPGTAVVVLLALGGLLVWQAEFVRTYFGRRKAL